MEESWLLNYKPNESCTLGWVTCINPYQVTDEVYVCHAKKQDGLKLYQVVLSHKREKWGFYVTAHLIDALRFYIVDS